MKNIDINQVAHLYINLAEIVRLYFEENLTLIEVGTRLGVCKEGVHFQI